MKVLHIITDLDTGGAEMMLYKLLASLQDEPVEFAVISLMGRGGITERIEELGIQVETLNMGQGERPSWRVLVKLKQLMASMRPDIVQGWMYHGNLAATLARWLGWLSGNRVALFWNIRQTLYDLNSEKRLTRTLILLSRWLSFLPNKIIYNSSVSRRQHVTVGFRNTNSLVIPNGFDLQQFRPNSERRRQFRETMGVPEEAILVGHISRFHPMKDHATLLRAVDRVVGTKSDHDIQFLLVGHGVTAALSEQPRIHFLGERADIADIMSALDMVVLTSAWGEGFPNVIGEAMATALPCVVTDVGDSAQIVGQFGLICSVGDDHCIADSLLRLIQNREERQYMGDNGRKRMKENYTMERIKREYLDCWH